MIPHSLHNKEYFWSYDEKFHFFSLFFSRFNRKYLKLIKIVILFFFHLNSSYNSLSTLQTIHYHYPSFAWLPEGVTWRGTVWQTRNRFLPVPCSTLVSRETTVSKMPCAGGICIRWDSNYQPSDWLWGKNVNQKLPKFIKNSTFATHQYTKLSKNFKNRLIGNRPIYQ